VTEQPLSFVTTPRVQGENFFALDANTSKYKLDQRLASDADEWLKNMLLYFKDRWIKHKPYLADLHIGNVYMC